MLSTGGHHTKKGHFTFNLEKIVLSAQNQFMKETNINGVAYGRVGGNICNGVSKNGLSETGDNVLFKQLDVDVDTRVDYYIELNKDGKIIKFYATDGEYQFSYYGSEGLNVNDLQDLQFEIDEETIDDFSFLDETNGNLIKLSSSDKEYLNKKYARVLTISDGLDYCTNDYLSTSGKSNNNYKTSYAVDDLRPCKFQYIALKQGTCQIGIRTLSTPSGEFK